MGHDQISQTIYLPEAGAGGSWDEGETHMFGTDGHGSMRVLYDLAGVIARDNQQRMQVYFYDAYGNLLSLGGSSLTSNTLPLTTYLYSGEAFDFRIGQQYLRARWYDARTGRFDRLDPFAGNSQDPQSLHKYGYVHGDPIQGIDPTGMFLGVGGLLGSFSIRTAGYGAMTGAIIGSLTSGIDKYLETGELDEAIVSGIFGGTVGAVFGAIGGGFAGALSQLSIKTAATFLKLAIVGNIVGTTYGVVTSKNLSQAGFRGSLGVFGTVSSITGLRLLQSVSDDLIRMMKRLAWDAERKGWKLVQGLGGFRLERFYGRTATPANTTGVDFVIGSTLVGKKVQLKGPFLDEYFQPLGRSPKQIADDLNPKIRNNTAADEFVIDTLGLTDSEAAELQQLIIAGTKKVTFLRNR